MSHRSQFVGGQSGECLGPDIHGRYDSLSGVLHHQRLCHRGVGLQESEHTHLERFRRQLSRYYFCQSRGYAARSIVLGGRGAFQLRVRPCPAHRVCQSAGIPYRLFYQCLCHEPHESDVARTAFLVSCHCLDRAGGVCGFYRVLSHSFRGAYAGEGACRHDVDTGGAQVALRGSYTAGHREGGESREKGGRKRCLRHGHIV